MRTLMCKDFFIFFIQYGKKGLRGFKQPKMGGPQQQNPNEKKGNTQTEPNWQWIHLIPK